MDGERAAECKANVTQGQSWTGVCGGRGAGWVLAFSTPHSEPEGIHRSFSSIPAPQEGMARSFGKEVAFVHFLFLVSLATVQHPEAPGVRWWDVVV